MVEQEAVNFEVASSSLAGGAMLKFKEARGSLFVGIYLAQPLHHHEAIVVSLHFLWVGVP